LFWRPTGKFQVVEKGDGWMWTNQGEVGQGDQRKIIAAIGNRTRESQGGEELTSGDSRRVWREGIEADSNLLISRETQRMMGSASRRVESSKAFSLAHRRKRGENVWRTNVIGKRGGGSGISHKKKKGG